MKTKISTLAIAMTLGVIGGSVFAAEKVKVGLMLPYTGTYAKLGNSITNGFKFYVDKNGGKLGGQEVEYFTVDDEADPAKAIENTNKLVRRDQVDVLVGTVHSGVALAMARVAKDNKTLMINPNAGADDLSRGLCSEYLFRTSFSNWQNAYAMGKVLSERKIKKVVTLTWKYAAGLEMVEGFKESFEKEGGGTILKEMTLPFPNVEFQAFLTEIASLKPDAVFVFFAGGGAVKFVKDYEAAGLKNSIPLFAPGFLTDGTLSAMGASGEGLETTLHYADGLKNNQDTAFRVGFEKAYQSLPDVYAVQGYDAAQLYDVGLKAAKGDVKNQAEIIKAMRSATIDSPRGKFTMSKAHNPIQNIYLRKVVGQENKLLSIAATNLDDPARGCNMK